MEKNIKDYATEIATILGATVDTAEKANGVVYTGVKRAAEGSNVAPLVYVNSFYENETPVEEAAKEIDRILKANERTTFELDKINDWEQVKPMLKARVYNKATKADVYKSAKTYGFEDLIIVPYINLDSYEGQGNAAIRVTKTFLEKWNVKKSEVLKAAIDNAKKDFEAKTMREMFKEMTGAPDEQLDLMFPESDSNMTVVTNKDKAFGAIGVVLNKAKLKKMFPNGYVVLPSSVHEAIVVPYNLGSEEAFSSMVTEVNSTQVIEEEQLSNRAYVFPA